MKLNNKLPQWLSPIKIAWITVGLFLLVNIALSLIRLLNKPFNPDELQHLHIAWIIANGDILYRDFWEHHGPLYSLLNGALIYLTDPEPSVRILFLSRFFGAAVIGGVMAITWRLARQLSLSSFGALLAIAVCSSIYFVQNKGVEMRPDSLQALFWTSGLYLLICNQSQGNLRRAIFAGALFALAILSNAKAGIGPVFVGIYYLTGKWLCRLDWADIWRDIGGMTIGACIAVTPFLVYFWANGAAVDFLYYNFVWNFLLNYYWSTVYQGSLTGEEAGVAVRNLQFLVQYQLPLLILTAVGAAFWLGKLRIVRKGLDNTNAKMAWLFIIATAGTSLGWMLNQHSQYFLMFLPFWSILVSYAFITTVNLLPERNRTTGIAVTSVIAVVSAANMLSYSISKTSLSESPLLKSQKYVTQTFVEMTDREELVALTWNQCGGYMFNPHVGHYWVAMPYISNVIEAISGEHPFSQAFIDDMEARQVRYVIGHQNWMTEGLSDEALAYLNNRFEYSNCLWTRKE
jgi:hypothetical protein